jgi:hypothetical protein
MMKPKSPRPGEVEGFGFHREDDHRGHKPSSAETQFSTREVEISRRIIVAKEAFGNRWSVTVEPRVATLPTQWARDAATALRIAYEMGAARGWPVEDRTGNKGARRL